MLSINIPVFNVSVEKLVSQIHQQAIISKIECEIRVYDDGSFDEWKISNRNIKKYGNVVYVEMDKNIGRAAIRNKMGSDSKFDLLLFIDADSAIVSEEYLETYLKNSEPNCVLCGGTTYSQEKPQEVKQMLRWVYGTKREAVSALIRNNEKGFILTSNNFLIEKKLFDDIKFREDIKKYGHEDTLLGYDLYKRGIKIKHLDNPVEHIGLEDSQVFLHKTEMALENLYFIHKSLLKGEKIFENQVNFLRKYKKIKANSPMFLIRSVFQMFKGLIRKNLVGKYPNLFWFDFYKLGFYSTLK